MSDQNPMQACLEALGWDAARVSSALAVAAPHDQRVAQAALNRLTLDDHAATFAAWCDQQAARPHG